MHRASSSDEFILNRAFPGPPQQSCHGCTGYALVRHGLYRNWTRSASMARLQRTDSPSVGRPFPTRSRWRGRV